MPISAGVPPIVAAGTASGREAAAGLRGVFSSRGGTLLLRDGELRGFTAVVRPGATVSARLRGSSRRGCVLRAEESGWRVARRAELGPQVFGPDGYHPLGLPGTR